MYITCLWGRTFTFYKTVRVIDIPIVSYDSVIHTNVYDDGDNVTFLDVSDQQMASLRLISARSIFTAETKAKMLVFKKMSSDKSALQIFLRFSFMPPSDIKCKNQNILISQLIYINKCLVVERKGLINLWIPSHCVCFI